jgi:hypothetical protein
MKANVFKSKQCSDSLAYTEEIRHLYDKPLMSSVYAFLIDIEEFLLNSGKEFLTEVSRWSNIRKLLAIYSYNRLNLHIYKLKKKSDEDVVIEH